MGLHLIDDKKYHLLSCSREPHPPRALVALAFVIVALTIVYVHSLLELSAADQTCVRNGVMRSAEWAGSNQAALFCQARDRMNLDSLDATASNACAFIGAGCATGQLMS